MTETLHERAKAWAARHPRTPLHERSRARLLTEARLSLELARYYGDEAARRAWASIPGWVGLTAAEARRAAAAHLALAGACRAILLERYMDHGALYSLGDGTTECECGAVMARGYAYAVAAWDEHRREVGAL